MLVSGCGFIGGKAEYTPVEIAGVELPDPDTHEIEKVRTENYFEYYSRRWKLFDFQK